MSSNVERKKAYLEAVKLNNISPSLLKELHQKSGNVIDKWLYVEGRYPSFEAIYELHCFLTRLRATCPASLNKLVMRAKYRINDYLASEIINPLTGVPLTKELRQSGKIKKHVYQYQHKMVTLGELRTILKSSLSETAIIARIDAANIKPGESIDKVDFSTSSVGPKFRTYTLNGKSVSKHELFEITGIAHRRIDKLLCGYADNSDITDVITSELQRLQLIKQQRTTLTRIQKKHYNRIYDRLRKAKASGVQIDFNANDVLVYIINKGFRAEHCSVKFPNKKIVSLDDLVITTNK